MKYLAFLCLILQGCTYSVTMAHTEGKTSDLIKESLKSDAAIEPKEI
jgi:hypothetical protein